MHYLADFDTQTKLLHVGYSVLGMLVSMLVLVKLKPTILPRMVTAVLLGFILVFCLSTPLSGDQERLKNIYSIGWFSLGLLFGIGRGEFVIEYLMRKFFGAPDQLADQVAKAEGNGEADTVAETGDKTIGAGQTDKAGQATALIEGNSAPSAVAVESTETIKTSETVSETSANADKP